MKVKILFLLCFSILAVFPAMAQTRSVTNADLEKFRQKRMKAEKDYRENYAKMGFPSPEELDWQIEKSRVERDALSARLTAERMQREQAEAERAEILKYDEQARYFNSNNFNYPSYNNAYPNTIYFGPRFPRNRRNYPNYPVNLGNGFPIGNYYVPTQRPLPVFRRPGSRWLRR